jgi:RNA polymerase sigma-70 factor (ECF subfamily)
MQERDSSWTEELVRAAQRGNRGAFRRLYEEHKDRVYATALRLLSRRSEAEDVTQEVFVKIYRKLSSFAFDSAFATWCYRITVNACYDRMRREERRSSYQGDYPVEGEPMRSYFSPEMDSSESGSADGDIQREVVRGLDRLSPKLRATFVLKEMEALSYREIAEVLECAEGTVASRLARARRQVAEYLRSVGIDETYLS